MLKIGAVFYLLTNGSAFSFAGGEASCLQVQQLQRLVQDCKSNFILARAAEECAAYVDHESKIHTKSLKRELARNGREAETTQTADLAANSDNLSSSRGSLLQLKKEAENANKTLNSYLSGLMYPGGISPKLAARLHSPFRDWLERIPCLGARKALLTKYISEMQQKIAVIDIALQKASHLAERSDAAESGMGKHSPEMRRMENRRGNGENKKAQRKPASNSSITGVH